MSVLTATTQRSPQSLPGRDCHVPALARPLQPVARRPLAVPVHSQRVDVQSALGQLRQGLKGQPAIDPAYVNGATFLKSLGINNQAEVARILDIAMNPDSMFLSYGDGRRTRNANARRLDVSEDMQPVVDYLLSKGVPIGDVSKIIVAHPPVLSYSVPDRLAPLWEYLSSVGVEDVAAVIAARPSLLGLDVENNLRRMVEYLRYVETPPETIVKYLAQSL